MTELSDTLLAVQGHDTAIDQLRHRLETLPARAELAAVRADQATVAAALAAATAQRDDLERRQAELESRIAAAAGRRHDLEARMRSAAGAAARDLQAMDHEVGQLAERQHHLEEEEMALLEEEEPVEQALAEHGAAAQALDRRAAELEATVATDESGLRADLAAEEAARAEAATSLPDDVAARYERLRDHLGGVGAARLVGDRCDGCHLTLPAVELEAVRALPPDALATCPQCDRLLVR